MRKATVVTRNAICAVALDRFCRHGYAGTTLQEIGDDVGLTRGAVLHHFHSKAELLAAVIDPWLAILDAALVDAERGDAAVALLPEHVAEAARRCLLRRFAELMLEHRASVQILSGDIGAVESLGSTEVWAARTRRLATLLAGCWALAADQARAAAAVGAILHAAACPWIDLDDPDARAAVIDAGLAAFSSPASILDPPCLMDSAGCAG